MVVVVVVVVRSCRGQLDAAAGTTVAFRIPHSAHRPLVPSMASGAVTDGVPLTMYSTCVLQQRADAAQGAMKHVTRTADAVLKAPFN